MAKWITVIDYGVGNLYNVRRAVEVCGGKNIRISDQSQDLQEADRIILPGVGAFKDGMQGLHDRDLIKPLLDAAMSGKAILGICLGMQLLATSSEEFGFHEGLSLIPGKVRLIPKISADGKPIKIPFTGWSPLTINNHKASNETCLKNSNGQAVYLVHSYQFIPENPANILATYELGGQQITAAIHNRNITGVQFHPEKSASHGLSIIKKFID